jgi:hypothetical protein
MSWLTRVWSHVDMGRICEDIWGLSEYDFVRIYMGLMRVWMCEDIYGAYADMGV